MPVSELPREPSLEHLRKQAKALRRRVRAGDEAALALVGEFHPRGAPAAATDAGFALADAQLVIARQYGFASWPKLNRHVEVVGRYSRSPHRAPEGAPADGGADARVDEFLRLACLTYGGDDAQRRVRARALLAAEPRIAAAGIHAAAAVGDVAVVTALLAGDRSLARALGGPHDWEPLLYACYSRLDSTAPGRSTLEVARLLLERGADPNAGYLWEGTYAFTALTGALGEGEDTVNQPRHQFSDALARMLLDAGADPNDSQGLYNRMFGPDDDHLRLLLSYGLGRGDGGPWYARLPTALPSPAQMLEDQLLWAAQQDRPARAALLLEHGVEPDGLGFWFTGAQRRTAYTRAVLAGNTRIAAMLIAAGAARTELQPAQELVAACLAADRDRVAELLAATPGLRDEAIAATPDAIRRAAELGRRDAVILLAELGFDVNALGRISALHEAASTGDVAMVDLLLALGADPGLKDRSFDATPLGWAAHGGHDAVVARLRPLTRPEEA